MSLKFVKPERLSLTNHSEYRETWIQQRIAKTPRSRVGRTGLETSKNTRFFDSGFPRWRRRVGTLLRSGWWESSN